jgi:hypothetical protein
MELFAFTLIATATTIACTVRMVGVTNIKVEKKNC